MSKENGQKAKFSEHFSKIIEKLSSKDKEDILRSHMEVAKQGFNLLIAVGTSLLDEKDISESKEHLSTIYYGMAICVINYVDKIVIPLKEEIEETCNIKINIKYIEKAKETFSKSLKGE